jgi:hypothetical protein
MTGEGEKLMSAWRLLLRGAHGHIIQKDLEYYATRQSHVSDDPYETAFRDGQRMLAQTYLDMAKED